MTLVIQILISLILLGVLALVAIGIVFVLSLKEVKSAISNLTPKIPQSAVFTDEPKSEEEIAIEREERILKTIRGEK